MVVPACNLGLCEREAESSLGAYWASQSSQMGEIQASGRSCPNKLTESTSSFMYQHTHAPPIHVNNTYTHQKKRAHNNMVVIKSRVEIVRAVFLAIT